MSIITDNEKKVLKFLCATITPYSTNAIARQLEMNPSTVHKIIKKFTNEGILKEKIIQYRH